MYDLSHQIEYLLLGHDCVVMPGFGAFINVHHPASFDSRRNLWLPPVREVRFNKALTHDDGLLANSYARKNDVSFEHGRSLMHRDIDRLQRELARQGELTLGNLGILNKNEGVITFSPVISASRLTKMLGFHEAEITANQDLTSNANEKVNEISSNNNDGSNNFDHKKEDTDKAVRFDTNRNYYIAINKTFAKVAASFIILAVIALAVIIPLQSEKKVDKAAVVPVEKIIEDIQTNLKSDNSETINDLGDKKETSESLINDIDREPQPSPSVHQKYHAIVATFNTEKEASKFISQYPPEAQKRLHIINTPTKSRVSAADSENREELLATMRQPDFRASFNEAWIWEY